MILSSKSYTYKPSNTGVYLEVDAVERTVVYMMANCESDMHNLRLKWASANRTWNENKSLHE